MSMMMRQNFDRFEIVKGASLVKSTAIFLLIKSLLYLSFRYVALL